MAVKEIMTLDSGLIDERLKALVNRRVASLNGCPF